MSIGTKSIGHSPEKSNFPKPTFLMCPPSLYQVNYIINPWMEGNLHQASRERATTQWECLYHALQQHAAVELVEPQTGSPDMVFTANAGLVHDCVVALSSFRHPERQGEEPHFRKWFDDSGFSVRSIPRASPFEGEGDALFDADGSRLWAGHGPRSNAASHRYLSETWGIEVVSLRLIDPCFYHLDTCFCPLFGGHVMYFPGAFDAASRIKIEFHYPAEKRICVGEPDALHFACNAVNVGRTVLMNEVSPELRKRLESAGYEVVQVQLGEFLKAGGAAKCLVLRLSSLAVTHGTA
jgi:ornithine--oxo-acid transaminase